MQTPTSKLTVRLPTDSVDTAKAYARDHGMTVTDLVDRYFRRLRITDSQPGEEVRSITGLLPPVIDGEADYRRFLGDKHSR